MFIRTNAIIDVPQWIWIIGKNTKFFQQNYLKIKDAYPLKIK
jgi:hypothetical protein